MLPTAKRGARAEGRQPARCISRHPQSCQDPKVPNPHPPAPANGPVPPVKLAAVYRLLPACFPLATRASRRDTRPLSRSSPVI